MEQEDKSEIQMIYMKRTIESIIFGMQKLFFLTSLSNFDVYYELPRITSKFWKGSST